jgi:hypothetical protein
VGATLNGTIRTVTIAGNFTNNGTVTLTTVSLTVTAGISSSGSLTYTGAGFFKVRRIYPTQELFIGAAAVQFTGTANQSIPAFTTTGTVSMLKTAGTATFSGNVNGGGLTINGTGGTLNLVWSTLSLAHGQEPGTVNCGSSLLRIASGSTV